MNLKYVGIYNNFIEIGFLQFKNNFLIKESEKICTAANSIYKWKLIIKKVYLKINIWRKLIFMSKG